MIQNERSEYRKCFWTIAGISLTLVLASLTIYWFAGGARSVRTPSDRCALLSESHAAAYLAEQDQVRVASPDFSTLVRLVGFMRYQDDQERLLPLRLHNVTLSRGPNDDTLLVLWTECAKLTLNVASDSKQLIVGSIEVATAKVASHRRECQVQSTAIKLADVGLRYMCNKPASYECKSGFWHGKDTIVMKSVAALDIQLLEFEVHGDPLIIRTNKFSKETATNTCT